MPALRHLLIFFSYAAAALWLGIDGGRSLPGLGLPALETTEARLLALAVFLGGALLHEIYARLGRETQLGQQLLGLRCAYAALLEQQTVAKQEAAALRDALDSAAAQPRGGKAVEEVIAEVKVLQGLVERLYESRARTTQSAVAAAAGGGRAGRAPTQPSPARSGEQVVWLHRPNSHGESVADEAPGAAEPANRTAKPNGARKLFRRRAKAGADRSGLFRTAAEPQSRATEAPAPEPRPEPDPPAQPAQAATPDDEMPPAQQPMLAPVAEDLDEAEILDALRGALRADDIQFVLQPVVSLPQRKKLFYECFTRLRSGEGATLVPAQYVPIAEREGLITAIDNMLLFRCIQLVRKIQRSNKDVNFFCNISRHTLGDADFFSDFVDFLESNKVLAPHLIFEFPAASLGEWGPVEQEQLKRLSRLGCRFSLDGLTDLDLEPAQLAAAGVAFVKIDETDFLAGGRRASAFAAGLAEAGIGLVVAKIETEESLLEVLDHGVTLGQGYLFGEPRLARPAD